ncbi:hypothetical protein [Mycobacteroides abscessus]|uniref:hypothetical protein n=1 Tax=Mycobacteroides abscessus TaxID=36809 RepID=UPI0009A6AA63|nr:hypothetical protein [Mycobacteroides abscessus]SLH41109.1 Uncharacterised protein [Mycobacteroides abscessus subsp. massiliense]
MSAPFTQDTANQIAQTKGFMGLLEDTSANNQQLRAVGDSVAAVIQGQTARAFASHHAEIVTSTEANKNVLSGITDALNQGIQSVAAQEETGASYFQGAIT